MFCFSLFLPLLFFFVFLPESSNWKALTAQHNPWEKEANRYMTFESNVVKRSGSKSDYPLLDKDLGGRKKYMVWVRGSVSLFLPVA